LRVGIVSDTHLPALFRQLDGLGPEAAEFFAGVDLILHAGDVTAPSVLDWLEQFAPVIAARGNNDGFTDPRLAPRQLLDLEGWRIGMVHNLTPEARPLPLLRDRYFDAGVEVMIAGHTHLERIVHADGLTLINAGSPILPHHKETRLGCVGVLELSPDSLRAEILPLGETPGRPNPTRHHTLEVHTVRPSPSTRHILSLRGSGAPHAEASQGMSGAPPRQRDEGL
jgi:putative phosphoesterase